MSKRNPRAKWVLPEIINPPKKICFQIQVPDEKYHIAAFLGALYNLTSAIFWSDDSAHTAKDVARVWQNIYDNISRQCVTEFINTYIALEDDMPFFRQVCENDVCYLEFECCPGEWVRLGNANQIPFGPQPGNGSPQPNPGGGSQKYCITLQANNTILIPTIVSAGDVVTIDASGSGNDGGEIQWRCSDGATYFGGLCDEGETRLDGGDPVPSANHMSLVINIAGTFYAFTSNSFTVPGGVVNQQAEIQVNDAALSNNKGSYEVCVTVTNNQAATWSHTFNFALSTGGWQQIQAVGDNHIGVWTPGSGWTQTQDTNGAGNSRRGAVIKKLFASSTITSVSMLFDYVIGTTNAPTDVAQGGYDNISTLFQNDYAHAIAGTNLTLASGSITHTDTEIDIALKTDTNIGGGTGGFTGSCIIKSVTITGTGTNPF